MIFLSTFKLIIPAQTKEGGSVQLPVVGLSRCLSYPLSIYIIIVITIVIITVHQHHYFINTIIR